MEQLYGQYEGEVEFFVVYIQEAHLTDDWQTESNVKEDVLLQQHQSPNERDKAA